MMHLRRTYTTLMTTGIPVFSQVLTAIGPQLGSVCSLHLLKRSTIDRVLIVSCMTVYVCVVVVEASDGRSWAQTGGL